MEKEIATHSSILSWKIPWTEEPGGLQSIVIVKLLSLVCLFETPCIGAHQVPLSMEFSRQEYWVGLPFPTPKDLPDPGIELLSLAAPALAGEFFTTEPPGKPSLNFITCQFIVHTLKQKKTLSLLFFLFFIEVWVIYNLV